MEARGHVCRPPKVFRVKQDTRITGLGRGLEKQEALGDRSDRRWSIRDFVGIGRTLGADRYG